MGGRSGVGLVELGVGSSNDQIVIIDTSGWVVNASVNDTAISEIQTGDHAQIVLEVSSTTSSRSWGAASGEKAGLTARWAEQAAREERCLLHLVADALRRHRDGRVR